MVYSLTNGGYIETLDLVGIIPSREDDQSVLRKFRSSSIVCTKHREFDLRKKTSAVCFHIKGTPLLPRFSADESPRSGATAILSTLKSAAPSFGISGLPHKER